MTRNWRTALLLLGIWAGCGGSEESVLSEQAAAIIDGTVGITSLGPIGNGNALTLPTQRHLVRIGGSDLIAIQQDGAGGRNLGLYRSDDSGQTWQYLGSILDQRPPRMTTDLIAVGNDIAVLYSFEAPTLFGSTLHDVYFQWWRRTSTGTWAPDPSLRIFDSTSSSTAYYRAEMARDSLGRIWVVANRLETDGSTTIEVTVSTNGGASFTRQPNLATMPVRAGGRLLSLGTRMMFIYDGHNNSAPTQMRLRNDSDPLGSWSAPQSVLSEGIYHGAAMSAVTDGRGGMHLFYKDRNQTLWYRRFDGSSFGPRTLIEDVGAWDLQPAAARIGDDVVVFYNRVLSTGINTEMRMRVLSNGVWSAPRVIDSSVSWKGYPAVPEVLPATATSLPCVVGVTPDANSAGVARVYRLSWTSSSPPPVDMASPPPPPADLASPSPADLGTPSSAAFSDAFARNIPPDNGLGASWTIVAGAWWTNGHANSDSSALNLAAENVVQCRDCTVQARVLTFATDGGVYLRAPSPTSQDRYELVLLSNARVQIRRVRAGAVTVLADAPTGANLNDWVTLTLSATGDSPVSLRGMVNGIPMLTATDASSATLGAGYAGLWTSRAGVWFDDFSITGTGPAAPADLGAPADLSTPPPTDLGAPSSVAVSDDFSRSIPPDNGLGAGWTVGAGAWWTNGHANSDSSGTNLAAENVARCADCTVQARVLTFATEGGVYLRAPTPTSPDRYELVLLSNARVQIRRVRAGVVTVLADAPSGANLNDWVMLTLSASGNAPVTLSAMVNGVPRLTATDASSAALGAGYAGLWTSRAGVWFDDFVLSGTGASGPGPATCGYGSTQLPTGACGMADLEVDAPLLAAEWYVLTRTVSASECEAIEGCLGAGTHRLLSFSLGVKNVGAYDLVLGDPRLDPAHFEFQACHNHYHFRGFASYRLLDASGATLRTGQKESFCIADTVSGPAPRRFYCDYQGLSAGWTDVYSAGTACQFLDITGLAPGNYTLEAAINPDRVFVESSYANNVARVPVVIP